MFPLALGTDTGGSVRNPASCCGIIGLKPTYGLVSRRGVFPLAFTLDHVGPMTRSVADNALLLQVMAAHDPLDPGSVPSHGRNYGAALGRGVKGLRVGYVRHFHETDLVADEQVAGALDAAAAVFASEGAIIRDVQLPPLGEFAAVNRTILNGEAWAIHADWLRKRPGDYGRLARRRLMAGAFLSAGDYVQAQRRRTQLIGAVQAVLRDVDVLLAASSMDPPCRIDDAEMVEKTYPRQARTPFNVTGHPALAMMSGLSAERLPLSLQIIGRYHDEATVYQAAAAFERATEWHTLRAIP
jgi:aspartyl-tRNA(Asn)/glutamyl-tRNA(Gln) amidotransferase subunit A